MHRQTGALICRITLGFFVLWALLAIGAQPLVVSSPFPHADALLVLAGGVVYEERVQYAARLFQEGKASIVLLTNDGQRRRWSVQLQRNPTSVEQAIVTLEGEGVAYHTRRTLWTLRQFLKDPGVAVGVEAVPTTPATPAPATWWATRRGWATVGAEFVKLPHYWLRFSLPKATAD
jgi:uncharacterized SAM-binding protein YcdF (DUF218 family)